MQSSPAIGTYGNLYIGVNDGSIYGLKPLDGKRIWHYKTGGGVTSSPAVSENNTLYVGSRDTYVYALNGLTGRLVWKFKTGGPVTSSPAIGADGNIYVGSFDGYLYALSQVNGKLTWKYRAFGPIESSPNIGPDGTLYVGCADFRLYAIDTETGRLKWSRLTGGSVDSSPAIFEREVCFGSSDGKVYALDAASGATRWSFQTGGPVASSPCIDAAGTVYIGSDDAHVYALNGATGAERWSFATGARVRTSPAIDHAGMVYAGSDDGFVYSFDGATGTAVRRASTDSAVESSPVAVGSGAVIFGGVDGGFIRHTVTSPLEINCVNRCYFPRSPHMQSPQHETSMTSRSYHKLCVSCAGLRLVYCNGWADATTHVGDTSIPGRVSVKSLIEYRGLSFPVSFSGSRVGTIGPGGFLVSDPIAIVIDTTVSRDLFVRTFVDAGSSPADRTQMWPTTNQSVAALGEGVSYQNDLTDPGAGGLPSADNAPLYAPVAILGVQPGAVVPSVAMVGDSIAYGIGDMQFANSPREGFLSRACDSVNLPWLKVCIPGDRAVTVSEQQMQHSQMRNYLLRYVSHVIDEYGHNDIADQTKLTALQSYASTRWSYYKSLGVKTFATTLTPRDASSDKYVTRSGQTPAAGFQHGATADQYNTWIQSGHVDNLDGAFDVRTPVQDLVSHTAWKQAVPAYSGTVAYATANSVAVNGAALKPGQYAGYVLIITRGATANPAQIVLDNSSSGFTIYSFGSESGFVTVPNPGDAFSIYPIMTNDGSHPTPYGHAAMAAKVDLSRLKL